MGHSILICGNCDAYIMESKHSVWDCECGWSCNHNKVNMKSCTNCKWEPDWLLATEDRRCIGKCKFQIKKQILSATFSIENKYIVRFDDKIAGLPTNCKTWEKKT